MVNEREKAMIYDKHTYEKMARHKDDRHEDWNSDVDEHAQGIFWYLKKHLSSGPTKNRAHFY